MASFSTFDFGQFALLFPPSPQGRWIVSNFFSLLKNEKKVKTVQTKSIRLFVSTLGYCLLHSRFLFFLSSLTCVRAYVSSSNIMVDTSVKIPSDGRPQQSIRYRTDGLTSHPIGQVDLFGLRKGETDLHQRSESKKKLVGRLLPLSFYVAL